MEESLKNCVLYLMLDSNKLQLQKKKLSQVITFFALLNKFSVIIFKERGYLEYIKITDILCFNLV